MRKLMAGDTVRVKGRTKYGASLTGAIGVVRTTYSDDSIAVEIPNQHNFRSQYNYFYFRKAQLELVTDNNNEKVTEGDLITMEGNYRIALVSFLDGADTDYTYRYACYDDSIAVNDICVVKSANHGFGIARVVSFEEHNGESVTREIVSKVDFTAYESRVAARQRKAELKKLMEKRAAALQETALFELLAKEDKDMAEMLKEFKELGCGC